MAMRTANPEALEWPSEIRAGFGRYEETFRQLRQRDPEAAARWRVAMLKAEWSLSDGYFADHDKWTDRAARIEKRVMGGSCGGTPSASDATAP
jgi:hypothetical protein